MMSRADEISAFLSASGFADWQRHPLPGDASTRRYVRLARYGENLMLMDQPKGVEAPKCPPGASDAERKTLGYNAMARLAGADCRPFAALSAFLTGHGISAPRILAADFERGLLVHEDFGDDLIARLAEAGADVRPFYEAAIDALVKLHHIAAPASLALAGHESVPLLAYDALALATETMLLPEWFLKLATGKPADPDAVAEYQALWAEILPRVVPNRPIVTLRDYHAENIFWLPARKEAARAGLIDFQDALAGHPAYDVISLLEDARRDVAPELAASMMARYVARARAEGVLVSEEEFREAAAILAAQRNAKIVGIFARLWLRDGKPRYLAFLPRMWTYLARDLSHPALGRLKAWFDRHVPSHLRGIPETGTRP